MRNVGPLLLERQRFGIQLAVQSDHVGGSVDHPNVDCGCDGDEGLDLAQGDLEGSSLPQMRSRICSAELSAPCRGRGGRMVKWADSCGRSGCNFAAKLLHESSSRIIKYATSA